jgi:hypothetical protein
MPCSFIKAQGISNSEPSRNISGFPDWFSEGYPYIHGIGVAPYSSYNPQGSYDKAKARAVQDLNANIMTSAHLETFSVTRKRTKRDFEFAIQDYYSDSTAVPVDSLVRDDMVYYLVRPDTINQMLPSPLLKYENSANGWTDDYFNPTERGDYYIAAGFAKHSNFAPFKSWTKAKLNALNKLAHYLSTSVQNRETLFDDDYNSRYEAITYQYSKAIFRNIYLVERTQIDGHNYVMIAVPKEQIYRYK